MVDAVNAIGGDARLTICEGIAHASWVNAYESKELFSWLFSQVKHGDSGTVNAFNNNSAQFG